MLHNAGSAPAICTWCVFNSQ